MFPASRAYIAFFNCLDSADSLTHGGILPFFLKKILQIPQRHFGFENPL
ncbi:MULTISPECIES: hypothetical protein [unclassified Helicobacter]|nr:MULTISPECIES: hypothetical protein [unclassified Helicobacter]